MSKSVSLLVEVPDDVYDNACIKGAQSGTSTEAVLAVATEQAMESIAENVKGLFSHFHSGEEEA